MPSEPAPIKCAQNQISSTKNFLVVILLEIINGVFSDWKMSVLNQSGEEQVECPLCMEPLEVDDLNFFPCTCGYQICRFCWHRIRTDENGLCPACRKAYPENPADFKPLSQEEVSRLKQEKRHKYHQRKQKVTENRKHLANVRVVQRNLVFVVGLPMKLADPEILKKHEYFGKFGKIHKVVINQSTTYAGSQGPSASAYVTYVKPDDALRAIQAVQNVSLDGRTIKTSLGTTKYCSHFMKNQPCPKPDCMYLHDHGDPDASFTKEEMQQGKHQEFEKKLHDQLLNAYNKDRKPTPSPPVAVGVPSGNSTSKESWPSLQSGGLQNSVGQTILSSSSNGTCNSSSSSVSSTGSNGSGGGHTNNNNKGEGKKYQQGTGKNKKKNNASEDSKGKTKEKTNPIQSVEKEDGHRKTNSHHVESTNPKHTRTADKANRQNGTERLRRNGETTDTSSDHRDGKTDKNDRTDKTEKQDKFDKTDTVENEDLDMVDRSDVQDKTESDDCNERRTASGDEDEDADSSTGTSQGSGCDWPPVEQTSPHIPDVLPPVDSMEDWQAAFGFGSNQNHQSRLSPSVGRPSSPPQTNYANLSSPSENKQTSAAAMLAKYQAWLAKEVDCNQQQQQHHHQQQKVVSQFMMEKDGLNLLNRVNVVNHVSVANAAYSRQQGPNSSFAHTEQTNGVLSSHSTYQQTPLQQQHAFVPPHMHSVNHLPTFSEGYHQHGMRLQQAVTPSAGPEGGFPVVDSLPLLLSGFHNKDSRKENECSEFLRFEQRNSVDTPKVSTNENYYKFDSQSANSEANERRQPDDDLGFDPFHETQKGLAEMMKKEELIKQQQQQQQQQQLQNQQHQQLLQQYAQYASVNHTGHQQPNSIFGLSINSVRGLPQQQQPVSNCTRLLEELGLGVNNTVRSRPPPPGFAPAPPSNHMSSYRMNVPRASSSNNIAGSKVLPLIGLGCSGSSNNIGNTGGNNSQVPQQQSFTPSHMPPFMSNGSVLGQGLPKSTVDSVFSGKDWPENIRSLLPNLTANVSQPPPNAFNPQKSASGWSCPDWTALDPAIVSSSRPHWPVNTPTPPPGFGFGQQLPHSLSTANMDSKWSVQC